MVLKRFSTIETPAQTAPAGDFHLLSLSQSSSGTSKVPSLCEMALQHARADCKHNLIVCGIEEQPQGTP